MYDHGRPTPLTEVQRIAIESKDHLIASLQREVRGLQAAKATWLWPTRVMLSRIASLRTENARLHASVRELERWHRIADGLARELRAYGVPSLLLAEYDAESRRVS